MFSQSFFDTKKWSFHQNFQLMSAVVRLKFWQKYHVFVSNKDCANTVLKTNWLLQASFEFKPLDGAICTCRSKYSSYGSLFEGLEQTLKYIPLFEPPAAEPFSSLFLADFRLVLAFFFLPLLVFLLAPFLGEVDFLFFVLEEVDFLLLQKLNRIRSSKWFIRTADNYNVYLFGILKLNYRK